MKILLGKKALIAYSVLAVLIFLIFSSFAELKVNKLLAQLTQELILQKVNPAREEQGFLDLEINEKLSRAAQLKAKDMIKRNYFSHTGPEGEMPWTWLDQVDYNYAAAGENLAMDVNDPELLVKAWLNSPAHAKNILNSRFTDIGIGIAEGEINEKETIVVVMFLGREMSVVEEVKGIVLTESIKNIPAQEPVIIKAVEIEKEQPVETDLAIIQIEDSNLNKTNFKLFLINKLPEIARLFLTILYSFLIILAFIVLILKKERNASFVLRPLLLLILILLMYLPSLI